jgi:hypothetical protein
VSSSAASRPAWSSTVVRLAGTLADCATAPG